MRQAHPVRVVLLDNPMFDPSLPEAIQAQLPDGGRTIALNTSHVFFDAIAEVLADPRSAAQCAIYVYGQHKPDFPVRAAIVHIADMRCYVRWKSTAQEDIAALICVLMPASVGASACD
jgi:hypothetical protein